MRLKKSVKQNEIAIISAEFQAELINGVRLLHESFSDLLEGKLDEAKLNEVIKSEHACDKIKERFIETLYKKKRALPFLIEDRYRMMKYLDGISDETEEVARILGVFPFKLFDDIKDDMKRLNDVFTETVEILAQIVMLMETDFKGAYQKTFYIETLKRKAREIKFELLKNLYSKEDRSLRVYLTSKLCIKQFDMISKAEEISDFLRSLIIKYPSK